MITSAEYRRNLEEIQSIHRLLISEKVTPFDDDSEDARVERMRRAEEDDAYCCKTYLPQYFEDDFAPFHYDMFKIMNERGGYFASIIGPKEHAKSTCRMGKMIKNGCFGHRHFHVLTSETLDQAISMLVPIKVNFEENPRIIQDFGKLIKPGYNEEDDFVLETMVRYLGRGINMPHKSLLFFQWRPDFMGIDDAESEKNTLNTNICKERLQRIRSEIYGALNQDGLLVWFGNWTRSQSAQAQLHRDEKDNSAIDCRIYRAETKGKKSLWPAHWNKKQLEKKRQVMGSIAYQRAFLCRDPEEGQEFPEKYLMYYDPREIKGKRLDLVIYGDPAGKGTGKQHSMHGWEVWARDPATDIRYCLHAWLKHAPFTKWIDAWFLIRRMFSARGLFEGVNAQENYREIFGLAAKDYGLPVPHPRLIPGNRSKVDRVVSELSPLWESRKLRFLKHHSDQDVLVEQFLYWGQSGIPTEGPDIAEGANRNLRRPGPKLIAITDEEELEEAWGLVPA
jgi:hypothetical protein